MYIPRLSPVFSSIAVFSAVFSSIHTKTAAIQRGALRSFDLPPRGRLSHAPQAATRHGPLYVPRLSPVFSSIQQYSAVFSSIRQYTAVYPNISQYKPIMGQASCEYIGIYCCILQYIAEGLRCLAAPRIYSNISQYSAGRCSSNISVYCAIVRNIGVYSRGAIYPSISQYIHSAFLFVSILSLGSRQILDPDLAVNSAGRTRVPSSHPSLGLFVFFLLFSRCAPYSRFPGVIPDRPCKILLVQVGTLCPSASPTPRALWCPFYFNFYAHWH